MPLKDPGFNYVPEPTVRAFKEMRGIVQTELGLYIPRSLMGVANGVATLDARSKVVQDPVSVLAVTVRNTIQSCVVNASGNPDFLSVGTGRAMTLTGPLTVAISNGGHEFVETVTNTVQNAWSSLPAAASLTSLTRSETMATAVCSAAHGFPVGGEVTIVGVTTTGWNGTYIITGVPAADTFQFTVPSTLTTPATLDNARAQPTVFLGIDRHPVTEEITFVHTLLPPKDDPIKPTSLVTDQHHFDPNKYIMERYNGTGWETKQRIFVGECVVDTAGIVAGSIVCYALLARYDSGWFDVVINQYYPNAHNIGTMPLEYEILAQDPGGVIARARYIDSDGIRFCGVSLGGITRKSITLVTLASLKSTAGYYGEMVKGRIIVRRGY